MKAWIRMHLSFIQALHVDHQLGSLDLPI